MKYEENVWYGWNGGECPVHPETVVEVVFSGLSHRFETATRSADFFGWSKIGAFDIIAFRVIKEHKEPREFWLCEGEVYENRYSAEYCCGDSEIIHVKEVLE